MFYIGISAYYHESSIFLTDGINTNCFLKEEYFTRIKGDKSFPKRGLEFLKKIEKNNIYNNDADKFKVQQNEKIILENIGDKISEIIISSIVNLNDN